MRSFAKALERLGRRGDTVLAHISPREAKMLKEAGGSGTRNPSTGLLEFFRPDEDLDQARDRLGADYDRPGGRPSRDRRDPAHGGYHAGHAEALGQRRSGHIGTTAKDRSLSSWGKRTGAQRENVMGGLARRGFNLLNPFGLNVRPPVANAYTGKLRSGNLSFSPLGLGGFGFGIPFGGLIGDELGLSFDLGPPTEGDASEIPGGNPQRDPLPLLML